MICDVCNSTEVEHCNDQVLCAQCGKVLEEETFVNVVQFLENTRGGSSVCGKVVGADGKEIWMNFFCIAKSLLESILILCLPLLCLSKM